MFNSYRYGYASFMSSQSDEHSVMGKKSALDSPLDINADYIGGEHSFRSYAELRIHYA